MYQIQLYQGNIYEHGVISKYGCFHFYGHESAGVCNTINNMGDQWMSGYGSCAGSNLIELYVSTFL